MAFYNFREGHFAVPWGVGALRRFVGLSVGQRVAFPAKFCGRNFFGGPATKSRGQNEVLGQTIYLYIYIFIYIYIYIYIWGCPKMVGLTQQTQGGFPTKNDVKWGYQHLRKPQMTTVLLLGKGRPKADGNKYRVTDLKSGISSLDWRKHILVERL